MQPFRQDVPDLLAAADIYVLPSLWEGLPIGLLEAMAMRKAIIATGVDGTREIIEQGDNGCLIDTTGLTENLTRALVELASDRKKRERLGNRAAETVKDRYNAEDMTRQIEKIYLQLTQKM
jgi:glycosyltransferase involved in cell wall biosynthesis